MPSSPANAFLRIRLSTHAWPVAAGIMSLLFGGWFAWQQALRLHFTGTVPALLLFSTAGRVAGASFVALLLIGKLHLLMRRTPQSTLLLHAGVLLAAALAHLCFNPFFSPLHWSEAFVSIPGSNSSELALEASLYKSFVWISQFSLSDMDYSFWAISPVAPTAFASPLLQALSWITRAPAADQRAFYAVLHAVLYLLCVAGSYGFFLFLRYGLKLSAAIGAAGGVLYMFVNLPYVDTLARDYFIAMSPLAVLPFALAAMGIALRENRMRMALWAGAALAAQFAVLSPHPDPLALCLLAFMCIALGMACATHALSWRRRISLLAGSGAAFACLSLFSIGPLLWILVTGQIHVMGHRDFMFASLWEATQLWALPPSRTSVSYLWMLAVSCITLVYGHIRGWRSAAPLLGFALLLALLMPTRSPLIVMLTQWLHIPVDLREDAYARRGQMVAFGVWALACCAADMLLSRLPKHLPLPVPAALIAALGAAYLLQEPQVYLADTSPNCPYYILPEARLASYPLLGSAAGPPHPETELQPTCMHPYSFRFSRPKRRYLLLNLSALYTALPTPFLRIGGFTSGGTAEGIAENPEMGDLHLGVGPGLFIHNASTAYDARFVMAKPLIHALYLMPGYDFAPMGDYFTNKNWALSATLLSDPALRKRMDIAGMDIITVTHSQLPMVLQAGGFTDITPPTNIPMLAPFAVLRNDRSYGMAYLAQSVEPISPAQAANDEAMIAPYLLRRPGDQSAEPSYREAVSRNANRLTGLNDWRAILLETDHPPMDAANTPAAPGTLQIRNVLGEAAVMEASCERTECVLVYNIAAGPGWKAYLDGKPTAIERANLAFIAIRVPHGTHEISIAYLPEIHVGLTLISLLGWIALLLLA